MAKCSLDIKYDIIDKVRNKLEGSSFTATSKQTLDVIDPVKANQLMYDVNAEFGEKVVTFSYTSPNTVYIDPSDKLVDIYYEKYLNEMGFRQLNTAEQERGGYTEEQRGEFFQLNKVAIPKSVFEEKDKMEIYGITSNQRSKIPLINKLLYRAITPANYNKTRILKKSLVSLFVGRDYNDFMSTIKKWREDDIKNNVGEENKIIPSWATEITPEQYKKREDAWALSNGLPQKHNTFKYVGRGFIRNGKVVFDNKGEDIYDFNEFAFNEKDLSRWLGQDLTSGVDKQNATMGKYAMKVGRDGTGYYLQYSDRWDLDLNTSIIKQMVNLTQKPFIVSGKLYKAATYDDNGNISIYYTQDVNNKDIQNYNDFLQSINEEEAIEQEQKTNESDTISSTASPKTLALIKDFIKRIGVDVKSMKQIVVNGVKQDANGAALIMQNLIQVVEGTEAVSLSEEAMHFAVEIIKQTNPSLYKTLLKEINNYALYKQVLDQYGTDPNYQGKDGKPDIQKLKEEAIAKVLEGYLMKSNIGIVEDLEVVKYSKQNLPRL